MNISVRQLAIVLLCDDALWPMIRIIKLNILGISIFPPRLQCPFRKRYNEKSNFLHKIYLILGNVGKMKLVFTNYYKWPQATELPNVTKEKLRFFLLIPRD